MAPQEQYEQEYRQKTIRHRRIARVAMLLAFLFTYLLTNCPQESALHIPLLSLSALCIIVMFGAYYAHRWDKFKYKLTNRGVRSFLFFNRVGEGFYSVMMAITGFLKAATNYFLRKKTRTEQNQMLILQRIEEMRPESRQVGDRIEGQLISLHKDVDEDAMVFAAILEDNTSALEYHCTKEQSLKKEISSLKEDIQALNNSDASKITELEKQLKVVKSTLSEEQERIDRLEEEKESLSKDSMVSFSFKDLLLGQGPKKKSAALEKMARKIAAENMNEKKEYLYDLAKFYRAMLDLCYIRENESKFAFIFHRDYGNNRDFTAYRRTFHNAVDRLVDYEYETIKDEIEDIVNA